MKMKFTAVGDMLAQRRIPFDYDGIDKVREQIKKGDFRFVNLETTINNGEFAANQFCGGSYLRVSPSVLSNVSDYGFNALTFVNNHAFDFGADGLLQTKRYVDEAGILNSGAGRNLDEAAAPAFLDTKEGRVAFISVVSTINDAAMAGKQSRRFIGRPGVNELRFKSYLQLLPEDLTVIRRISGDSMINAQKEIERAEGYHASLPDGVCVLGELEFREGSSTKFVTYPHPVDMARIERSIESALGQADYVVISVHSHELSGNKKENVSDFLSEFAHRCIDKGAHAVIGHGPHLLRPLEIYKNRPIFYSLGDFVIHNECVQYAPEDMYAMQSLTSDATITEFFNKRSAGGTRGLMRDRRMLEAVIPYFEMEDGKLTYLELMPIELNFDKPVWQSGNPRFSREHGIIERYAEMSASYGTKIKIDERGFGIVELSE